MHKLGWLFGGGGCLCVCVLANPMLCLGDFDWTVINDGECGSYGRPLGESEFERSEFALGYDLQRVINLCRKNGMEALN